MAYVVAILTSAAVVGVTYYVFRTIKKTSKLPTHFSITDPDATPTKGEGVPRVNIRPLENVHPTVYHNFKNSVELYGDKPCYGYRPLIKIIKEEKSINGVQKTWEFYELGPYIKLTYKEVEEKVRVVASGYRALGLNPGDFIGIYEETCFEWSLTAHAAFSHSIIVTTVYSTLGEEAVSFAINQTRLTHLFTNGRLLGTLAKVIANCPSLKYVIYVDTADEAGTQILASHGIKTMSFSELLKLGSEKLLEPVPPEPDDTAVVMYTSGSTGNPKGVILKHKSMASAIRATIAGSFCDIQDDDVYISFLPLAHVLALVAENAMLSYGVFVGFGNPRSLVDSAVRNCRGDFAELKPTLMAGVPTIYDRIKKGARDKIEKSGAVTHALFKFAYEYKKSALSRNEDTPFWNNLVFNKLKAQMGGRIRVMLSGGAPLSQDTQQFLRICFSCSVIQGYGLTETCGGATIMHVDDPAMGVVGAPLPGVQIKLVDVEDMNYKSTTQPPQGEVWIKGPNVANGYYNDVEQTQKSFIDGWFVTGDVGEWTEDGTLKIIDRIKNLIKMAHGEYIALESVESRLKNSPYVENICAYGDGTKTNLVALVVPARHKLLEWAQAKKIPYTDYESLCNDRKARSEVLSSIIAAGRAAKMRTNELPKDVFLCHEEWTPQNEMLTAAMKLKRPALNRHFKNEIDAMYSDE